MIYASWQKAFNSAVTILSILLLRLHLYARKSSHQLNAALKYRCWTVGCKWMPQYLEPKARTCNHNSYHCSPAG